MALKKRRKSRKIRVLYGDSVKTVRRAPKRKTVYKKRKGIKLDVDRSIVKEIWAVIYLSFGILTLLSVYGKLGIVGDYWIRFLQPVLGWGIYFIPVVFILLAVTLFFAEKVSFGFTKILGLICFTVSILGILHLSVPMESLFDLAEQGLYGGLVGFVSNYFLRTYIGSAGTLTVFVALFLISLLLSFDISLVKVMAALKPKFRKVKEDEKKKVIDDETQDDIREEAINIIKPILDQEKERMHRKLDEEELKQDVHEQQDTVTLRRADRYEEEYKGASQEASQGASQGAAVKKKSKVINWEFPSLDLLSNATSVFGADDNFLKLTAERIKKKLKQFGIEVQMKDVNVGPTVIQYTLKPDEGVKLAKITTLKNDLALTLAAKSIRLEAPIPGKALVGIEVPSDKRAVVRLREIMQSPNYSLVKSNLALPLGRDVSGKALVADLLKMPHMLIAGATGSGKSVCLNTFLISLLYQNSPEDLKFIMVDPKRVELTNYNGIPHLLTPVITDPEKAAISLRWVVAEMNRRYQLCSDKGHRNITDYNKDSSIENKLPKIIIVIDELADMMMAAGKEVEASICRIAQMARAVGIHLIIATQRPSVDVITGLIKANIPCRISFAVASQIDSRTILDGIGAEDLLGAGDMLYLSPDAARPVRIQGIYISTKEVERVTNKVKLTVEPDYNDEITSKQSASQKLNGIPGGDSDDDLYEEAFRVVKDSKKASASLLQRRLKVGYARAARLLDMMEENGVIGPSQGAKPREIYVD